MAKAKAVSISSAEIDEFGDLDLWKQQHQAKIDRHKNLKDLFRKQTDNQPGDQPVDLDGRRYSLHLAARKEERAITNQKRAFEALKKAMGLGKLIEALTFTFKLLDRHFTEDEQKLFVKKDFTGYREVSVVAKASAKAA